MVLRQRFADLRILREIKKKKKEDQNQIPNQIDPGMTILGETDNRSLLQSFRRLPLRNE